MMKARPSESTATQLAFRSTAKNSTDSSTPSSMVSIGMPCFNCERTLATAIRSILNQTYINWELLLIDDGSSDRTLEVARKFSDPRIHVFADGTHRGLVPRLNQAVAMSRGQYFARLDADDIAYPERLERQVEYLKQHPEIDLLGCSMLVFKDEGFSVGMRPAAETHEKICQSPLDGFAIGHPTWMGPIGWFRAHPYDREAVRAEDQVLLLRSYSTSRFACLPEILCAYREDRLVVGKILRGRYSFASAVLQKLLADGQFITLGEKLLSQLCKAFVDVFAVVTGLNYGILGHRARPLDSDSERRWIEVWRQVHGITAAEFQTPLNRDFERSKVLRNTSERIRVVNIVTSSLTVRFLEGQPQYFSKKGFDVTIVSSFGEELAKVQRDGVQTTAVPMAREISPLRDLQSLWRLWRVLFRLRPTITNVATPKAGLLGGIAAWMCRVPCRYYSLVGLRCETTTGLKRQLLLLTERISCLCAHRVICVSPSLRKRAIELGIVDARSTVVLASGGYTGVDPERFAPSKEALNRAGELRHELGIPEGAPVVGFVGRLTRDKGIAELVEAFSKMRANLPKLRLLLVGEFETGDPLPAEARRTIQNDPGIIHTGFVEDPILYYHVMDVLAFPTKREGFGNVAMEGSAAGKPVVSARATGAVDAVIDGVTGILVPVGDAPALADALERVLEDKALAAALGAAGRERVQREFRQETIWDAIIAEYYRELQEKGLPLPNWSPQDFDSVTAPIVPIISQ